MSINPFLTPCANNPTPLILKDIALFSDMVLAASQNTSRRLVLDMYLATHGISSYDYDLLVHGRIDTDLDDDVQEERRKLLNGLAEQLNLVALGPVASTTLLYVNLDEEDRNDLYASGSNLNRANCVGAIMKMNGRVRDTYYIYGNDALRSAIKDYFNTHLVNDQSVVIKRVKVNGEGNLIAESERIHLPEGNTRPDLFYPNQPLPTQIWDDFSQSSSRILILQGDVGTGKSSYLRDMLHYRGWKQPTYIVDHSLVHDHPGLGDFIRGVEGNALIIFEDADALLAKRTDGNTVMSSMLNSTSGIVSTNVRLAFTVNLPNLKYVDKAFLRPGRTFRLLEFGAMSKPAAQAVREYMQKDPADLISDRDYTLAEAINYEEISHDLDRHGFGFT